MKAIETSNAPLPLGHYSQGIIHNGLVYVSGQLPIDPKDPNKIITDIHEQTIQTLKNLDEVLKAANSDKFHVLKVTIFISSLEVWPAANTAYSEFFETHKPARSAVPTNGLPKGYAVEIEAIAAQKQ
jgi:2-iminobutanoate/2-iminopropanoate deaminase